MSVTNSGIAGEMLAQQSIVVRNPWNNEVITELATDGRKRVREKLDAAWAFRPRLTPEARREILSRARQLLIQRKLDIARLISAESGLSLQDSVYKVDNACALLNHSMLVALFGQEAALCDGVLPVNSPLARHFCGALCGVAAVVTSFHHPLSRVLYSAALAIATNNRIVVKPSSKTPLSARALRMLLLEAGMPEPVFTLVNCADALFIEVAAAHYGVDFISFTGMETQAREMACHAPAGRLVMETGVSDALIVCADVDLQATAALAARGAFFCSGRRFGAVKRLWVDKRCHDEFVRCLAKEARAWRVGDPLDPKVRLGTMIDAVSAAETEQRIALSLALGATCVSGNERCGASLSATVLTRITPDMPVITGETSGPVVSVMAFTHVEEAIEQVNGAKQKLNASFITGDKALPVRDPDAMAENNLKKRFPGREHCR
jgi:acyl-CoA reductase-like NAD-dependent aldehyde dehydrogenase